MTGFVPNSNSNRVLVISDDESLVENLKQKLPPGKRLDNGRNAPQDVTFHRYSPNGLKDANLGRFGLCVVDLSSDGAIDAARTLQGSPSREKPYYVALAPDEFTTGDRKHEFLTAKFDDTIRSDPNGNYLDYLSDRVGTLLTRAESGIVPKR